MAATTFFSVYDNDGAILEYVDIDTMAEWILDTLAPSTKKNHEWEVAMEVCNAVYDRALTTELWRKAKKVLGLDFQMYMRFYF